MKPLFCALALAVLTTQASHALAYDQIIAFGDSLTDSGNIYAESGKIFPSFNPIADPQFIYTARRLTDGPDTTPHTSLTGVWVEQLATKLGLTAPTPSANGGTNFAYAGATTGTGTTPLNGGPLQALNTSDQVGQYLTAASFTADPNALYVVWSGSNDITIAADKAVSTADAITAGTTAEANTKNQVQALLSAGAQHVLWLSVAPLNLIPDYAGNSDAQAGADAFHSAWLTDLALIQSAAPGALTGLDVYSLFGDVIANPSSFGLTNANSSAYADSLVPQSNVNPDTYLFWDGEHPTTKGHQLLADAAFAALTPEPASLSILTLGLTTLALRRLRN